MYPSKLNSGKDTVRSFTIRLKKITLPENVNKFDKKGFLSADAGSPSNLHRKIDFADEEPNCNNSLQNNISALERTSKPPERSVLVCQFCAKSFIHNHMQHAFICHYRHNTVFCCIAKCKFESKFVHTVQFHIQAVHKSKRKPINKFEEHLADIQALTKDCFPDWQEEKGRRSDQLAKKKRSKDGLKCNICIAIVKNRDHATTHLNAMCYLKCKRCAFSANLVQTMRKHYEKCHKEFYWKAEVDTSNYAIAYKKVMKECFGRSPGLQSSKSNADSSRSSECTSLSASDVLSSATFKVPSVHDNSRIEVQNEPEISIVKAVDCHPSVVSRLLPPVWGGVRVKEEDDLPLFLDRNRPMNLSSIAPSSVCSRAQSSSTYTEYSEMDAFASSNRACSVTPEPAYMHSVKPELECDSQSLSPALLPTPELQRHLNIHAPTQDNAGSEMARYSSTIDIEALPNSSTSASSQTVNASVVAAVVALTQEIIAKQNQLMDILRTNNLFPSNQ